MTNSTPNDRFDTLLKAVLTRPPTGAETIEVADQTSGAAVSAGSGGTRTPQGMS